jgi:hypothetical protein
MSLYEWGCKWLRKGYVIPVTGLWGQYCCDTSRLPHCLNNRLTDGTNAVSTTCRLHFTPGRLSIHICVRGWVGPKVLVGIISSGMETTTLLWNSTKDIPTTYHCSILSARRIACLFVSMCKMNTGCFKRAYNLERWIFCTPLSVNVSVTLTTEQHLEYNCKIFFETPCIISGSHMNRNYLR